MKKIIFLDTVATGTNPDRCCIYRIGGIYTEDGVEKKRFEMRMRPFPNARINDQSLYITGETRASLTCYPSEAEVFGQFISFLDGIIDVRNARDKAYIAGFNVSSLDIPFIKEWFRRNGNERFRDYFYVQNLDMMNIAAFALVGLRDNMPDFHLETVARFLEIRHPRLSEYDSINNAKTSLEIYRKLQTTFGLSKCADTSEATDITRNF